jgi:hypothetical protein
LVVCGKRIEHFPILDEKAMDQSAKNLLDIVGRLHGRAVSLGGFGWFCRNSLGLDPLVLM